MRKDYVVPSAMQSSWGLRNAQSLRCLRREFIPLHFAVVGLEHRRRAWRQFIGSTVLSMNMVRLPQLHRYSYAQR
jgi:hypothetical protein